MSLPRSRCICQLHTTRTPTVRPILETSRQCTAHMQSGQRRRCKIQQDKDCSSTARCRADTSRRHKACRSRQSRRWSKSQQGMTHKSFDRKIQRQVIRGHTTNNSTHRSGCGYQQGKDCSSTAQCCFGMCHAHMQSTTLPRSRCICQLHTTRTPTVRPILETSRQYTAHMQSGQRRRCKIQQDKDCSSTARCRADTSRRRMACRSFDRYRCMCQQCSSCKSQILMGTQCSHCSTHRHPRNAYNRWRPIHCGHNYQ
jgi:hypothetical protein